nr:hypothetical protein [Tanacetum cinerariifolium]
MESQSETTQTVSTLKLLVLKTREYDLWSMRMEQYITFTDHALWEVIVNGDPVSLVASSSTGVEGPIPPKTAEQKLARKNKLKAKSTLMLAIPGEHLLKFHACKDAKSLLETIKNRTKVECYNCHKRGHFAREYKALRNQRNKNKDAPTRNAPMDTSTTNALVVQDGTDDAFLTKSKQVPVNAAKQSSNRAAASVSAARHVNIAASKPNVNKALPTAYSYFKAHSPVNNVTTARPKAVVGAVEGNKNNAVKSLACWIWRPKGNLIDHISKDNGSYTLKRFNYVNPQGRLKSDQGIFDSRCSRHMTGKKSYIIDYQEINGGFVAFRENAKGAKITRKAEVDVVQRLKEKALRD